MYHPETDPEESDHCRNESDEEDPEMETEEQYLEYYPSTDPESGTDPLPAYRLMDEDVWDTLTFCYCPPRWRSRAPGFPRIRIPCECKSSIQRRTEPGSESPEPCDPGPSRVRDSSPESDDEPRPKKPCMDSRIYRKRFGAP